MSSQVKCIKCGDIVSQVGDFKKGYWTYYCDKGRRWRSKRICPNCNVKSIAAHIKKKKKVDRCASPPEFHPTRKCRACKQKIQMDRYYHCHSCVPQLDTDIDEDFLYVC